MFFSFFPFCTVDDIDEEELWKISPDQLSYYKAQFKTLQIDPCGLVSGAQARPFFEKSRLPTAELSHIWYEPLHSGPPRALFAFLIRRLPC